MNPYIRDLLEPFAHLASDVLSQQPPHGSDLRADAQGRVAMREGCVDGSDLVNDSPALELVRRPERERRAQAAQPGLVRRRTHADRHSRAICEQGIPCPELQAIDRLRNVTPSAKQRGLAFQWVDDEPVRRGRLRLDLRQPESGAVREQSWLDCASLQVDDLGPRTGEVLVAQWASSEADNVSVLHDHCTGLHFKLLDSVTLRK